MPQSPPRDDGKSEGGDVGSENSGSSGDGGGQDDVLRRALVEKVTQALLDLDVDFCQKPRRSWKRKRPNTGQLSLWRDLEDTGAYGGSDDALRMLLRSKLVYDVSQVGRAAARRLGPPRSSRVRMKCGICEAFLGMTEYTVDADGVGTVACKTVCGTCLEDAMRRAAAEGSGPTVEMSTKRPVIAGGGKGDGQPRARLQMVSSAGADKRR